MEALRDLIDVVEKLRSGSGCPWDRAQTLESLLPYLLEETYEVMGASESRRNGALCEELGDLLYLVVLMSRIAEESGIFSLEDVAGAASSKMRRRHPSVFGGEAGEVGPDRDRDRSSNEMAMWESEKARERPPGSSRLAGVPATLPALLRAHRVGEKASSVGFEWPDADGVFKKMEEEREELGEAMTTGDMDAVMHEYGDLLHATSSLGRYLKVSPEDALRRASRRFEARFAQMEALAEERGLELEGMGLEPMEELWREVKRRHGLGVR